MKTFVNLTSESVFIFNKFCLTEVECTRGWDVDMHCSCGIEYFGEDQVQIVRTTYGKPANMPDQIKDTLYIVPEYVRLAFPERKDLVSMGPKDSEQHPNADPRYGDQSNWCRFLVGN